MNTDTVMYSGKCKHGNIAAHCNLCVKEREAMTSAAELDRRERMAFEIYKNADIDLGHVEEIVGFAFKAADAFLKVSKEIRGRG